MSLEWTLLVLRLLAVAVLYAFLAIAIYVIWRDVRAAAQAMLENNQMLASTDQAETVGGWLQVVSSSEASLQPGDDFTLQTSTFLGRASDNHVVLPDSYVSTYHARIDRRDSEWWLTDLGSRNGTQLNDVFLTKSVPLVNGDVIGVGQIQLKLVIEDC